jgi:hypothetical protein
MAMVIAGCASLAALLAWSSGQLERQALSTLS